MQTGLLLVAVQERRSHEASKTERCFLVRSGVLPRASPGSSGSTSFDGSVRSSNCQTGLGFARPEGSFFFRVMEDTPSQVRRDWCAPAGFQGRLGYRAVRGLKARSVGCDVPSFPSIFALPASLLPFRSSLRSPCSPCPPLSTSIPFSPLRAPRWPTGSPRATDFCRTTATRRRSRFWTSWYVAQPPSSRLFAAHPPPYLVAPIRPQP